MTLDQVSRRWLQASQQFFARHRVGVVTTAITALGGFAVTAFGIAPLAPDAALLPQRVITQTVTPDNLQDQLSALSNQPLSLRRSEVTRGIDTPASLLARLGVNDASAVAFLGNDPTARRLLSGRGGKMVQVSTADDGRLTELIARYPADDPKLAKTNFTRMTVTRTAGQWLARLETVPYQAQVRLGSGTIRSSLFAATDEALLPDAVGVQLADIFGTEIDFHRELRKGDTFSVVYQALTADGEVVPWNEGAGRVLAAEFVNNGRAHQALWFGGEDGEKSKGGYFGVDGNSKHRSFLASPVAFSRITSGFSMRFHPILKKWKAHLGVDFGAPIGTAVRTVGDGTVLFAGQQNGYGNVIEIKHGGDRSTLYAHLSRIDVRKGEHVDQGETIGAVGMTGWATGPHLHFEFLVHGQHVDPVQIARASEPVTLDPADRARFAAVSKSLESQLHLAETTVSALAQSD